MSAGFGFSSPPPDLNPDDDIYDSISFQPSSLGVDGEFDMERFRSMLAGNIDIGTSQKLIREAAESHEFIENHVANEQEHSMRMSSRDIESIVVESQRTLESIGMDMDIDDQNSQLSACKQSGKLYSLYIDVDINTNEIQSFRETVFLAEIFREDDLVGDVKNQALELLSGEHCQLVKTSKSQYNLYINGILVPDRVQLQAANLSAKSRIAIKKTLSETRTQTLLSSENIISSVPQWSKISKVASWPEEVRFHFWEEQILQDTSLSTDKFVDQLCKVLVEVLNELGKDLEGYKTAIEIGAQLPVQSVLHQTSSRRNWLKSELDTWILIAEVTKQRKIDMALASPKLRNPEFSDIEVISNLSLSAWSLRWLRVLKSWLEQSVQITDLNHSSSIQLFTPAGHHRVNFKPWPQTAERLLHKGTSENDKLVPSVAPDGPLVKCGLRIRVLPLDGFDQRDETELLEQIWKLVRSGRRAEAVKLCSEREHHWRAISLGGGEIQREKLLYTYVPFSNPKRALWRDMCCRLAKGLADGIALKDVTAKAMEYEAAIYAILGGDYSIALESPLNRDWEGQLWCLASAAIDCIEERELLEHREEQIAESLLYPGVDVLQQQRSTVHRLQLYSFSLEDVLEQSNTQYPVQNESYSALRKIQESLLFDDHDIANVIVKHLHPLLCDGKSQKVFKRTDSEGVKSELLRFSAHYVLHLKRDFPGVFIPDSAEFADSAKLRKRANECSQDILCEYIRYISSKKGNERYIALYAAQIEPVEKQRSVYASFLKTVNDQKVRAICIQQAEKYLAKDLREILRQVVRETRLDEISERPQGERSISDGDKLKMNTLIWLCFFDDQIFDLIRETNALLRQFQLQPYSDDLKRGSHTESETSRNEDRLAAMDALLTTEEFLPLNRLKAFVNEHKSEDPDTMKTLREFKCWLTLVSSREKLECWRNASASSEPPGPLQIKAKNACQALDEVLYFTDGWNLTPSDEELISIRGVCLPGAALQSWHVMHSTGIKLRDMGEFDEAIRWFSMTDELAVNIADEKFGVYKLFSLAQLRQFLRGIHSSNLELLRCKELKVK